jgi:hypothetical protein
MWRVTFVTNFMKNVFVRRDVSCGRTVDRPRVTNQEVMPSVFRIADKSLRAIHLGVMPGRVCLNPQIRRGLHAEPLTVTSAAPGGCGTEEPGKTDWRHCEGTFRYALSLCLPPLGSWWWVELIAMHQGTGQKSVAAVLPFVCWPWIRVADYRMRDSFRAGGFGGNASVLGSWGAQFEFWPGHRLSRPRLFVVSLSLSWQMLVEYLKPCHNRFLPHPSQFIIHCHPSIRRCVLWVRESVSK